MMPPSLAVSFTDTINLGAILIVALSTIGIVVGVIYGARYKVSYEAASAAAAELRQSLADERARVERMEAIMQRQRDELRAAQEQVARLESLPDLAQIVSLLDSHEQRAQERHERAEQRSQERHEANTTVLLALAERLGATDGHIRLREGTT